MFLDSISIFGKFVSLYRFGFWDSGPIDTHVRYKRYKVVNFCVFLHEKQPKEYTKFSLVMRT